MTNGFDNRKNAFEAQFAQDQQLQFRVEARACKLFGQWLAEKMGMDSTAATGYANEIVVANLDQPGLNDVLTKALSDLRAHGAEIDESVLQAQLATCILQAKEMVMNQSEG